MGEDYVESLIRQRITAMSDADFDHLIAETRPTKRDPKKVAIDALRAHLGYRDQEG